LHLSAEEEHLNFYISGAMLTLDANLDFLRCKLMHIRSAVCCIEDNRLAVRTHIVETEKIDNEGYIYFTMPHTIIGTGITNFPVKMLYRRKNVNYFLEVEAHAFVYNSDLKIIYSYGETRINHFDKKEIHVKAKILKANYLEKSNALPKELLMNFKSIFKNLSKSIATLFY
jgi:hypothetical protein